MSYKEKPLLKIFKYENNAFKLQAIIDDYQNCSFERNKFEAGQFSIQINYNIPNSQIFEKGLFIQFGNDSKDFGLIKNVSDEIGPDGKGSQIRTITGYDARILFKQRIIKNLNFGDSWSYTGSGELCMRNLINSQCGNEAENKRKLPIINTIPSSGIGSDYTVSEAYSNLYDVLVTIATQTEIGWGIEFVNNQMSLYFYNGVDRHTTVKFSTDYDSLQNGSYEDGTENFSNSVYVGGKGSGENRDIYEGETGETSPSGLDRYESWDDANSLENDDEYENEAKSKLNEYSNTVSLSGNGLAKCPYEYKKEYDVGDIITVQFSGKTAIAQILSITENWAWGQYDLQFEFGKPIPSLNRQLNFLLSKIQTYQATADSVKKSNIRYYEIPTETEMPNKDVILDVIGFEGNMGEGATFKLYFDSDSKVGAKTYHLYFKALAGSGKLTLTSGVSGKTNLELGGGTYVAIVYVDEEGNIGKVTGTSNYNDLENKPVVDTTYSGTSTNAQSGTAVASALDGKNDKITVTSDNNAILDETGFILKSNSTETNLKRLTVRSALVVWDYIKGKISSVLGLTQTTYNGKAKTINKGTTLMSYRYASTESPTTTYYWYKLGCWSANNQDSPYYNKTDSSTDIYEIQIMGDTNYNANSLFRLEINRFEKISISINLHCLYLSSGASCALRVAMDDDGNVYIQSNALWQNRNYIRKIDNKGSMPETYTRINYKPYGTPPDNVNIIFQIADTGCKKTTYNSQTLKYVLSSTPTVKTQMISNAFVGGSFSTSELQLTNFNSDLPLKPYINATTFYSARWDTITNPPIAERNWSIYTTNVRNDTSFRIWNQIAVGVDYTSNDKQCIYVRHILLNMSTNTYSYGSWKRFLTTDDLVS